MSSIQSFSKFIKKILEYRFFWANLAIIVAVVLWGLSFVSMKIIMNTGLPPYSMITMRYLLVSVVLLMVFVFQWKKPQWKRARKDYLLFFWSGGIGITAYFLFEAKGISLTTASNAAIIIAMVPVFSLIADWVFFRQSFNLIQLAGIILSIFGVYVIFYSSQRPVDTSAQPLLGNLLMLGACFCWVAYSVLSKALHRKYGSFVITSYQSFFGTLLLLPFALVESSSWVPISLQVWGHLFYLSLLCSILAYYLYNIALRILGVTIVSVYVNLIPLVGVIGAVYYLHDPVFPLQIFGGSFILISLFLVNQKKKQPILIAS